MIVGVVQARLGSSRLPKKALLRLAGKPMVAQVIGRVRRARRLDKVVAAIPPGQHPLWGVCIDAGVEVVEGPEMDLIQRYLNVIDATDTDAICRITADCAIIDPGVIDLVAAAWEPMKDDYCSNVHPRSWPDGLDVEIISAEALRRLDRLTSAKSWLCAFDAREEFTRVFWERPGLFSVHGIGRGADDERLAALAWSVNTPDEYAGAKAVYEALGVAFTWQSVWRRFGRKSLSEISPCRTGS